VFAMVMDRFRPMDLTPRRWVDIPEDCSLPEEWPISYEELDPYYQEAEALFRVRGTHDTLTREQSPLLEPPPPSDAEVGLGRLLTDAGLHPYRLHYAREAVPGCTGCPVRLCPHECRNDANRICLLPALQRHNAYVLPQCQVVSLGVIGSKATQAECLVHSREVIIRGKVFVLALGAFQTPALLLRSTDKARNNGLGHSSDLVGRNLMLHVSDTLLVRSREFDGVVNKHLNHGLALNDFYIKDHQKLGNIHAHAFCFPGSSRDRLPGSAVFHTIVEDFPYLTNRVFPREGSSSEVVWEYQYPKELRMRSESLVAAFTSALDRVCEVHLRDPVGGLNISHACGTCRFGDNAKTSVLDRENRIHDLDNAYVVDASFFPSSGGIHPSLTIVANSLRVSERIATNCF
jgi:choline dehydrogenase-like flavoprotein